MAEGIEAIAEKARFLFKAGNFASCFKPGDYTAVKIHIGEAGNTTYIPALCFKGLISELLSCKVKAFCTDTSALCTGRRHNAIDHAIPADAKAENIAAMIEVLQK